MCSKCYKEQKKAEESKNMIKELATTTTANVRQSNLASTVAKPAIEHHELKPTNEPIFTEEKQLTPEVKQPNPGRCYQCKAKVSLIKRTTNKCKCKLIFCDNHRQPENHSCEVDIAKQDKDVLAQRNPKLHSKPTAGNSFTRID
ncbi:hypothetical protein K502DRAFT_313071 [Neoconidiobolus thromboides FSU 785]|nr:hypothetical protein K502DRAFT_313071 [Neoconidiobolus thromboides FSU 785]